MLWLSGRVSHRGHPHRLPTQAPRGVTVQVRADRGGWEGERQRGRGEAWLSELGSAGAQGVLGLLNVGCRPWLVPDSSRSGWMVT